jgi:hypothetical protein
MSSETPFDIEAFRAKRDAALEKGLARWETSSTELLAAYTVGERDFRRANLSGAYLRGAHLEGANLSGANLSGANLEGANLEGANLSGATLEGANLEGANLSGANLRGADLSSADLSGATLRGAILEGANLEGAKSILAVGPIGSREAILYLVAGTDGAAHVKAGCFYGTLDKFKANVAQKRDGDISRLEYEALYGFLDFWQATYCKVADTDEDDDLTDVDDIPY